MIVLAIMFLLSTLHKVVLLCSNITMSLHSESERKKSSHIVSFFKQLPEEKDKHFQTVRIAVEIPKVHRYDHLPMAMNKLQGSSTCLG